MPGLPPPRLSSLRWKAPPPNARNKAKPYSSHGGHSWKAPGPGEVRGRAETAEEKRARGVPVHVIKRNARRAAPRKRRNMPPLSRWEAAAAGFEAAAACPALPAAAGGDGDVAAAAAACSAALPEDAELAAAAGRNRRRALEDREAAACPAALPEDGEDAEVAAATAPYRIAHRARVDRALATCALGASAKARAGERAM